MNASNQLVNLLNEFCCNHNGTIFEIDEENKDKFIFLLSSEFIKEGKDDLEKIWDLSCKETVIVKDRKTIRHLGACYGGMFYHFLKGSIFADIVHDYKDNNYN